MCLNFEVDHIFICCGSGAPEADVLVEQGLREGAPNTHPGQGTANKRFFFENMYLELLYVCDEEEARGPVAASTRLWERCAARGGSACPFGIVLRPAAAPADAPPFATWTYRPPYLPPGWGIEMARDTSLLEPEIFYLPFAIRDPAASSAPRQGNEAVNRLKITGITIGIPNPDTLSQAARWLGEHGFVRYEHAPHFVLTLHSNEDETRNRDLHPSLPLRLAGSTRG